MRAAQDHPSAHSKSFSWCVYAVLAAYVGLFAWRVRDCFVDDAFIVFQYLRNLTCGQGFVFFPGGPVVEGITNIGWLFVLVPFAAVLGPTAAAKLLGLVLVLVAMGLTILLADRLAAAAGRDRAIPGLAVVPVVLLTSNFSFLYFSLAGMETALMAVLLLTAAWLALRRADSLWLPVFAALAFMVHPEALLLLPIYTLLALGTTAADQRRLLLGNLLLAVLLAAITAVRWGYFHDLLPNTFHSKPSNVLRVAAGGFSFLAGRNVNIPFPVSGWLALPVLVLGYLRLRAAAPAAAAMLGAIALTGLAFGIYSPPDWSQMGRYFAPYLPATLILFWVGLVEATGRLLGRVSLRPAAEIAAMAVILLLVVVGVFNGVKKLAQMDDFPGYVLASRNLVGPSLWMRDHLPEHATIATRRIGALAYFSDKAIFDYTSGLPDAQVARLVAGCGHRFNLPTDPALAELWPRRSPDFLLEDAEMIDLIASQSGGTRQRFTIHGLPYGVMKSFPIGRQKQWVLARRLDEHIAQATP